MAKATVVRPPNSSPELAEFLLANGLLSEYQATMLLGETEPPLRLADFVIRSDRPVRPLSHWIPAQTAVVKEGESSRHGFLLRVPLTSLDATIQSWLRTHAKISAPNLQSVELSGGASASDTEKTVEIFSPLAAGQTLFHRLGTDPLPPKQVLRIGIEITKALSAIHEAPAASGSLAHGAVGCDHIWITEKKGKVVLLRDPSSAPSTPYDDPSVSWIERLEPTAAYAAPELTEVGACPTPQSDIYSLGCVLYTALLGHRPFSGADNSKLIQQHRFEVPDPLRQAAEQGADGDPVLRVLAYAMAKDPSARFATAKAFGEALRKVSQLLPASDSSLAMKTAPAAPPVPDPQSVPAPPIADSAATGHTSKTTPPKAATESAPAKERRKPTTAPKSRAAPTPPTPTPETAVAPPPNRSSSDEDATIVASAVASEPSVETASGTPGGTSDPAPPPPPAEPAPQQEPQSLRRRRKRKKNRVPILAGMMVLPVLMLGLAIMLRGRGPEPPRKRPRPNASAMKNVPKVGEARNEVVKASPAETNGYSVVESDRLLWVPPYAADSPPPTLELLPPGPAGIISVSMASINQSDQWSPIRQAFGNEISALTKLAAARAGVSESDIKTCTTALFPGKSGFPETTLAIELNAPLRLATLTKRWNASESRTREGATVFAGEELDSDAYYLAGGENGKVSRDAEITRFAVGPLKHIREVADNQGGSIPLTRSLQNLWDRTSIESDLVVLMTPNFLFADGRELLRSAAPEFQEPAKRWLIPNVGAVALSITASESDLYLELRQATSGGATPSNLLRDFRQFVDGWPDWADEFILRSVPDPSWRLLANRLPMMLRFVGEHTRSTIDDDTVVASTYLPTDAAAQVALGSLLAMNTAPGELIAESATPRKPLSVDEMLDRPMSISFTQESLQFAVDAVSDEFSQSLPAGSTMPKVRVIGGDLELSGITQNQQIRGFEKSNIPLRQVLTELVLGANPDKTATGPKDPKQSLVWVVHPQGKPSTETEILITTRAASKGKYELPPEFVE